MKAFCIGLVILILLAQFKKGSVKISGFLGLFIAGCMCWGLGSLVLLILGAQ